MDAINVDMISGTVFGNVICQSIGSVCQVIDDSLRSIDLEMTSSILSNVNTSFYSPNHRSRSQILFTSITVRSSALWSEEEDVFLSFNNMDNVVINRWDITYSHDISKCRYSIHITNSYGIENALLYKCSNPMTLIQNSGQIQMIDTRISVTITNEVHCNR